MRLSEQISSKYQQIPGLILSRVPKLQRDPRLSVPLRRLHAGRHDGVVQSRTISAGARVVPQLRKVLDRQNYRVRLAAHGGSRCPSRTLTSSAAGSTRYGTAAESKPSTN